jgi:hypothetical protein
LKCESGFIAPIDITFHFASVIHAWRKGRSRGSSKS